MHSLYACMLSFVHLVFVVFGTLMYANVLEGYECIHILQHYVKPCKSLHKLHSCSFIHTTGGVTSDPNTSGTPSGEVLTAIVTPLLFVTLTTGVIVLVVITYRIYVLKMKKRTRSVHCNIAFTMCYSDTFTEH